MGFYFHNKDTSKTIPQIFINRWYVYHSQSWVVYGIVLPTLTKYLWLCPHTHTHTYTHTHIYIYIYISYNKKLFFSR